jgi:hypothetical protein
MGAQSYRLQVSVDSCLSSRPFVLDSVGIADISQVIQGPLTANTTYYWRVNASDGHGTSDWSIIWKFTTNLGPPILDSPSNNEKGILVEPILKWHASPGGQSYGLQVSVDSNFTSMPFAFNSIGIADTKQLVDGLTANTTYYWRVNASDGNGTSDWSSVWKFTTNLEPAMPFYDDFTDGNTNGWTVAYGGYSVINGQLKAVSWDQNKALIMKGFGDNRLVNYRWQFNWSNSANSNRFQHGDILFRIQDTTPPNRTAHRPSNCYLLDFCNEASNPGLEYHGYYLGKMVNGVQIELVPWFFVPQHDINEISIEVYETQQGTKVIFKNDGLQILEYLDNDPARPMYGGIGLSLYYFYSGNGDPNQTIDNVSIEEISNSINPPAIQSINAVTDKNPVLTWSPINGANAYNIYRGTTAYFTPDKTGGSNRIASNIIDSDSETPGVQWIDTGNVIGDPATNYFYVVTAKGAMESDISNRVGKFDYNLVTTTKTDFNEIAIPLNRTNIANAQQLMAAVPGCNSIARWNAAIQGYDQYIPGFAITNFTVTPGYPYYVNVTTNGIFTLLGELTQPVFNLITTAKTDFNEIMLPLEKTAITKASELMADIPNCNSVAKWNASTQGYDQYVPGFAITNFSVNVGYPYYVNLTANTIWPSSGTAKPMDIEWPTTASNEDGTHAPHAAWGRIMGENATKFRAHIETRETDVLTETSPGSLIQEGYWLVQCATFQNPWKAGEKMIVECLDEKNTIVGLPTVSLTYNPEDKADGESIEAGSDKNPNKSVLSQNYPNPFNAETRIQYQMPKAGNVEIAIYDMMGRQLRKLMSGYQEAGTYEVTWNGRDDKGQSLASGIYLCRMQTEGFEEKRKVLLMK